MDVILVKDNYFFLPIPKNASSSITKQLIEQNFRWGRYHEIENVNDYTMFTVLRDPFDRWISGFTEDIYNEENVELKSKLISEITSKNSWFLDWTVKTKNFNIGFHTQLQVTWIPNKKDKKVFFCQEKNLNFKLYHWLNGEGVPNSFVNQPILNQKKHYDLYQKISEYFFDAKNQDKKTELLKYLQPDYDLINSITFY